MGRKRGGESQRCFGSQRSAMKTKVVASLPWMGRMKLTCEVKVLLFGGAKSLKGDHFGSVRLGVVV